MSWMLLRIGYKSKLRLNAIAGLPTAESHVWILPGFIELNVADIKLYMILTRILSKAGQAEKISIGNIAASDASDKCETGGRNAFQNTLKCPTSRGANPTRSELQTTPTPGKIDGHFRGTIGRERPQNMESAWRRAQSANERWEIEERATHIWEECRVWSQKWPRGQGAVREPPATKEGERDALAAMLDWVGRE
ncbi:hypothetical protein BDZ91DRAFT_799798 [Kalaharituber pfeilii]|nr:hypothetical protein BDZ91DRAFT_799798 [Kalaharituber pfeilii]